MATATFFEGSTPDAIDVAHLADYLLAAVKNHRSGSSAPHDSASATIKRSTAGRRGAVSV